MRLWHVDMLGKLPRQQLLGQHRECCALRGDGWGRPHSTVNYVFDYDYSKLFAYHQAVMQEMDNRGYNITKQWLDHKYRGKRVGYDNSEFTQLSDTSRYNEHNASYYGECCRNLREKGVIIK